ncbi:3-keto-steroid reductase [Lambiella insularis]|nr:3-keto-steroid reductase [Lambiella insularis]
MIVHTSSSQELTRKSYHCATVEQNTDHLTSGLGFATCCRLADEFLGTRPASQSLKLIITTRSPQKSKDTIARLTTYLNRNAESKVLADARISFHAAQLDLTSLRSVLAAAASLLSSLAKLDVIILNAGIAGPHQFNWPLAVWAVIFDTAYVVTYPYFVQGRSGLVAKPQLSAKPNAQEPPLGEVFCANVFGHYLLVHHLSPLLSRATRPPARIICLSSLEQGAADFSLADMQCLTTTSPYQSSKRLTDILALTAALPSSKPHTDTFFTSPASSRPLAPHPRFYVSQPGICNTEIFPLMILLAWAKVLALYMARWLGSPWHTISTYKGACAPVWLALAGQEVLDRIEEREGQGKWGSATDVAGRERVRRTEVDGWGYGGWVGQGREFGTKWRRREARDLTVEDREAFEELGRQAWGEMERLRVEWEERLG